MRCLTEPSSYHLFVGVDVASRSVSVSWLPSHGRPTAARPFPQTAAGYTDLQQRLVALGVPAPAVLIVLEATGTYWIALATTLAQAGFAVAVINPAQAHAFAKALLKRSKTDAIDAQTLAQFAALLQPAPWTTPPAIYAELQQRLAERDALVTLRTEVQNQRHALLQQPVVIPAVRQRMEQLIALCTQQIAEVEQEIARALQMDPEWAAAERLQTITGIGLLTAAWILVTTLNFTLCRTATEAVGYAGLAPNERQSGTRVRGRARIGHTGNPRLRRALYLATLSATQRNPVIKVFYDRLRAVGKPAKVARCAAARKLLHIAWAVATKGRTFDPTYTSCPQG